MIWIVAGRVQDRYTDKSGRIDCLTYEGERLKRTRVRTIGMPHFAADKFHCWGRERVVLEWKRQCLKGTIELGRATNFWEFELSDEDAAFKRCPFWT